MLDLDGVLCIDEDLDSLGTISCLAIALADDLGGVDEILENSRVDGGEGARARSRLLGAARSATGFGKDSALANEDDLSITELLLEFTSDTMGVWMCLG